MTMTQLDLLVALFVVIGIIGAIIQIYPGLLITALAIAIWGGMVQGAWGYSLLTAAILTAVGVSGGKYLLTYRHLTRHEIARSTIIVGALCAAIGFYLLPVIGLFIGFPLGVYLDSLRRSHSRQQAWRHTKIAVKGIGWGIILELGATLALASAWVIAVIMVR